MRILLPPESAATGLAILLTLAACQAADAPRETSYDLRPDAPREHAIPGGHVHVYPLRLADGQVMRLAVEQRGVDVEASLLDPEDRPLLSVDSPTGTRGTEELVVVAGSSGIHTLRILAWEGGDADGTYVVELETPRTATADDRVAARALAVFARGESRRRARSWTEAVADYREALELWHGVGLEAWEGQAHERLGRISWNRLGDASQALVHYEAALPLLADSGDRHATAKVLYELGRIRSSRGETDAAIDLYRRALDLRRELGDRRGEASAANNLGRLYQISGELQDALDAYRLSLERWSEVGDDRQRAHVLHNRATAYRVLGRWRQALDDLERALRLWERFEDHRGRDVTLIATGQVYGRLDELDRARRTLERALEGRREAGDLRSQGVALTSLGVVLKKQGRPLEARARYEEALALFRELGDRRQEARVLHDLGLLDDELGRYDAALAALREAGELFEAAGEPAGEARLLVARAGVERRGGDLEAARRSLETALAKIETLRAKPVSPGLRSSYFATQQGAFEHYVDLLVELHRREPDHGHDAAAFEASERARARTLLELLNESGADLGRGADPELYERRRELRRRIRSMERQRRRRDEDPLAPSDGSSLEKELRDVLREYEEVRSRIRATSDVRAPAPPEPLGLAEIRRQVIDEETLLLEYKLGEQRGFLWAVTSTDLVVFELPGRAVIERQARLVYRLLSVRGRRRARVRTESALAALSATLLGPVADRLGRKRLLIVKDGVLDYIPFAALPAPVVPLRGNVPLVVEHEIVSMPSASALAMLRQRHAGRTPAPGWLAVVADPVFEAHDPRVAGSAASPARAGAQASPGPERLVHSREEAEAILALAPPSESFAALGFDAHRETVLTGPLERYRVLHFATHGDLDAEHPELTRLVFSKVDAEGRPRADGGDLYAHEIYGLDLPAELVVLSACQTALGREIRGEGLVGLTQAFLHAGAARLVVSLWNVDDRSTALLMERFYRALIDDGLPAGAALRSAQVSLWRERPGGSPHDWAAFVLQGEWRGALFADATNQNARSRISTGVWRVSGPTHRKEWHDDANRGDPPRPPPFRPRPGAPRDASGPAEAFP